MASGWVGSDHTALLDSAGQVWTVGCGGEGKLGHGTWNDSVTLERVDGLPSCSVVSSGDYFTLCVSAGGQVYYFGGIGREHPLVNIPHQVKGLPSIRTLQCGSDFVVCVDDDFYVWSWGCNSHGQLGLGYIGDPVITPTRGEGVSARQVACGGDHTLIITTEGQLCGCGNSGRGQLGQECKSSFPSPTLIPVPFEPYSIHCGYQFSVVRATDGTLWCTGLNDNGQLGLGDIVERSRFTQIPDIVSTQVACGWDYVVAVDEQSRLWGWGYSPQYQLSPLTAQSNPTPTILREDIVSVLVGQAHTLALTTDDQVVGCGINEYCQLGNGASSLESHWTVSTITPDMMQVADRVRSTAKSARSMAQPDE